MRSLVAAIQFLTIMPIPSSFQCGEMELKRSVVLFPIVGHMIGGLLGLLDIGIIRLFPPLLAGSIMVVLMMMVSGCFHMDGLADTADGFLSARPKERILEIMRDSRIGSMGVVAVIGVILLKVTALASIPVSRHWIVVVLMPLAGRCALVLGMAAAPYARLQGGLASAFGRPPWPVTAISLMILSVTSWSVLGIPGLLAAGTAIFSTIIFSFWCRRKIGGFTGDTLGAACEIAETMPALIAASWRWLQ
jgi:adenosylcobinamide-GDP ribazoletransferase